MWVCTCVNYSLIIEKKKKKRSIKNRVFHSSLVHCSSRSPEILKMGPQVPGSEGGCLLLFNLRFGSLFL